MKVTQTRPEKGFIPIFDKITSQTFQRYYICLNIRDFVGRPCHPLCPGIFKAICSITELLAYVNR